MSLEHRGLGQVAPVDRVAIVPSVLPPDIGGLTPLQPDVSVVVPTLDKIIADSIVARAVELGKQLTTREQIQIIVPMTLERYPRKRFSPSVISSQVGATRERARQVLEEMAAADPHVMILGRNATPEEVATLDADIRTLAAENKTEEQISFELGISEGIVKRALAVSCRVPPPIRSNNDFALRVSQVRRDTKLSVAGITERLRAEFDYITQSMVREALEAEMARDRSLRLRGERGSPIRDKTLVQIVADLRENERKGDKAIFELVRAQPEYQHVTLRGIKMVLEWLQEQEPKYKLADEEIAKIRAETGRENWRRYHEAKSQKMSAQLNGSILVGAIDETVVDFTLE